LGECLEPFLFLLSDFREESLDEVGERKGEGFAVGAEEVGWLCGSRRERRSGKEDCGLLRRELGGAWAMADGVLEAGPGGRR